MSIDITPEIEAAYRVYLDEPVDADFSGRPILRRNTYPFIGSEFVGLVGFAAGFQVARAIESESRTGAPAAAAVWDASQIKQPGWNHVAEAFLNGAREARENPAATERDFERAADGYSKRVFEEVDPASEAALRTMSWAAPLPSVKEPPVPDTNEPAKIQYRMQARTGWTNWAACSAEFAQSMQGESDAEVRRLYAAPVTVKVASLTDEDARYIMEHEHRLTGNPAAVAAAIQRALIAKMKADPDNAHLAWKGDA